MNSALREEVEALVGSPILHDRALAGGDINEAHVAALANGHEIFVKSNRRADPDLFKAEAHGLAWLAEARSLRVPAVLAVGSRALVLEWIAPGRPATDFDERLGRGLAALHQTRPPGLGLERDNFIGALPQVNAPTPTSTWAEFYRIRRLEPQLRLAIDAGLLPPRVRRGFSRLLPGLDERVAPAEPVARLHGDLWNGNVVCDDRGSPVIIDPAAYGGDREVDLAMMRLFGGFSPRVFSAYQELWPLPPGHAERVPLYQLYPILVHLNLFGGGYLSQLEAALLALV